MPQVPPELVPGRMVLVITTLLTLTGLFNANVSVSLWSRLTVTPAGA